MHRTVNSLSSSQKTPDATAIKSDSVTVREMPGKKTERAVFCSRLALLATLVVVSVVFGVVAFYGLKNSETELAEKQFRSLAQRAASEAAETFQQKPLGTKAMAKTVSYAFPDESVWPMIAMRGFEDVSAEIVAATEGQEMGIVPVVKPEDRVAFEEFAYDWLHVSRLPEPFPNTTAVSSFGKGMWQPDPENPGQRLPSNTTETSWGSPYQIFTPLLQATRGINPALMMNLHAERGRGQSIDAVVRCAEKRREYSQDLECLQLSEPVQLAGTDPIVDGPGSLFMVPIYPADSPLNLTGILASRVQWNEMLIGIFESSVSGVDCLLETASSIFTFRIINGVPIPVGAGDFHDKRYNGYATSVPLTGDLFSESATGYKLTLYPNSSFFDVYSTTNPNAAAVGASLIIVFTSLLFVM